MNFLTIFVIGLATLVVSAAGIPIKGEKQILWFPNEEGTGMVPAILGDDFNFDETPNANPNNINFYLWTHNSEKKEEIENTTESVDASHWDKDAPVKVFSHGFSSTSVGGASGDIKNAYLIAGYPTNVNLVLVDWGLLAAAPWYDVAALGTKVVGQKTAYLLDFLVRNGYTTVDKIHVSGHSLGAHVAGYTGADFFKLQGKKIPRVTGLDPALPRFGDASDDNRIDPTDADFVDVMHTNAGVLLAGNLAFREPCGHVDVYPNKGSSQPGCGGALELIAICSHMRAATLYAESVNSRGFVACKCDDDNYKGTNQFKTCDCVKGQTLMGEWAQPDAQGIYYLTTKAASPFAQG